MKGTTDGGERGGVSDMDVECKVRLSGVVGLCVSIGGASGSGVVRGGSGKMLTSGCFTGSGVDGNPSFPRSGGQALLEEDVAGVEFSESAEIPSPECDEQTEVSLRCSVNAVAAITALSPYRADFGTAMGLGDSAGREGVEEEGGGGGEGATD